MNFKFQLYLALEHLLGILQKSSQLISNRRSGKIGVPGEKQLGSEYRTNKLNPHLIPILEIKRRPHWWEAGALITAPSLTKTIYEHNSYMAKANRDMLCANKLKKICKL